MSRELPTAKGSMTRSGFRFDPPRIQRSRELSAALALAFGPLDRLPGPAEVGAALELGSQFGLLQRIASRTHLTSASPPLEHEAHLRLQRARAISVARELWLDETLAEVAEAATRQSIEPILLKGRALALAGHARPLARPTSDLDLLVTPVAAEALRRELESIGYVAQGASLSEHHAAPLRRPGGAPVELHRHLPGVRLVDRRSATADALQAAGLVLPPAPDGRFAAIRLPAREVLIAHALVHALVQHGFATTYPGWRLIGDLIDLRAFGESIPDAPWRTWVARDLSAREIDAALALARRAATGEPLNLNDDSDEAVLARHFVASALDVEYGRALRSRQLEDPLSERPRPVARIQSLLRAFVPPIDRSEGSAAPTALRRAARWIARPFVLAAKAARSVAARTRLARRR